MSENSSEQATTDLKSTDKGVTDQSCQDEKSTEKEITKHSFRKKVWDDLIKTKVACFPSPYGRIPNFKGAELAAEKLLELEEFKLAKCVEVNPDKPLEPSRVLVLENGKELYVPVPRLRESLLKKLSCGDGELSIKRIVSGWGIENTGQLIGIDDQVHIDLFVLGSVAVSKEGFRIGKGKGYADLEFALLKEMKAIDDNTVIVTTVHDSQVFDELPNHLFKKHDVPIDYILTPTQIIKVENKIPKPNGIFWDLLSQRRLNEIEVLQKLKEKHESKGKDTTLKDVDSDVESTLPRRFYRHKKSVKKRPKTKTTMSENVDNNATSEDSKTAPKSQTRRRYFKRSVLAKTEDAKDNETQASENNEKYRPNFSLYKSTGKGVMDQSCQDEKSTKKEITKHSFRRKVWDELIKNKVACFPRPYGQIPNFKGADLAAEKLLELEEFKLAKCVEVNPDKPLEPSRILVLENGKELYVPVPRLRESLLKKLSCSEGELSIKRIVSGWGIENTGQLIGIHDQVHIDLFVLGSVAVSKEGFRIGKGKGYADLEFALLKEMKAIDDNTVIVTTVHDSQVFEELPNHLFKKHDVPIDYILTPTQVIKVENKIPKPKGIFWDLLSQRRLNEIEVLQKLKEKYESEGEDTTLKDVDSDVEDSKTAPKSQTRRRNFKRSVSAKAEDAKDNETQTSENNENIPPKHKKKHRKLHIDFSLLVTNIERSVRVRDLKNALRENGIKPNNITWKGYRGFCYLHYANKNNKSREEDEENEPVVKEPVAIDNVIEILQGLKFSPDSTTNLNVKVMEPITRIETTDVTAV